MVYDYIFEEFGWSPYEGRYRQTKIAKTKTNATLKPERAIFNDPATIVYWNDGTKTVVKCDQRDSYDKEAGLAMCFMKKMCGSSRSFNDTLKRWTE